MASEGGKRLLLIVILGATLASSRLVAEETFRDVGSTPEKAVFKLRDHEHLIVDSLVAGEDGGVFAIVRSDGIRHAVFQGERGPSFDRIDVGETRVHFPTGQFTYKASRGCKSFVVDRYGQHGPFAEAVVHCSYAYSARTKATWQLVVRGHVHSTGMTKPARQFRVSSDRRRWLCVLSGTRANAGKETCVVDGVEGRYYDRIDDAQFSPDGKQTLFRATRSSKELAVLDGKEGPEFDRIGEYGFGFRSNGKVQYVGKTEKAVEKTSAKPLSFVAHVVTDGTHSVGFDRVALNPPRLDFVGFRDGAGYYVNANGKVSEGNPSPGGTVNAVNFIAFGAAQDGKRRRRWVTSGIEGPLWDSAHSFESDRDGNVMYVAAIAGKETWMVNHRPLAVHERITVLPYRNSFVQRVLVIEDRDRKQLLFGSKRFPLLADSLCFYDSMGGHVAYNGVRKGKPVAAVNGIAIDEPAAREFLGPYFFHDGSKHITFARRADGRFSVRASGRKPIVADSVSIIERSTDLRHLAFAYSAKGKYHVVIDGEVGPSFDMIERFPDYSDEEVREEVLMGWKVPRIFGFPEEKPYFCYCGIRDKRRHVMRNDDLLGVYDLAYPIGNSSRFCLAVRGRTVYLVDLSGTAPPEASSEGRRTVGQRGL